MSDPCTVDRHLDLDLDPGEAAALATTVDGWRTWLVDEAAIDLDADGRGSGTVVDDGIERGVRVHERSERSVRFTWWETAEPASVSEVVIRVHPTSTGSRVVIGERRVGVAGATARASIAGGLARWELRACLLAARAATAFVLV